MSALIKHLSNVHPRRLICEALEDRRLLAVVTVDDSGGADFLTIQAAVDAADPGDTIEVAAGVYNEQVTIDKTLVLLGAQAGVDACTRDAVLTDESVVQNANGVFVVRASGVVIDGFTVQGAAAGLETGIHTINAFSGYRIENNIIQNNVIGIFLNSQGSLETVVRQNAFINNNLPGSAPGAIYSDAGAANITIDENCFSGSPAAGINFSGSVLTQFDIRITDNEFDVDTVFVHDVVNLQVSGNTFDSPAFTALQLAGGVIDAQLTDNTFLDPQVRAIFVSDIGFGGGNNRNITISGNTITADAGALFDAGSVRPMIDLDSLLGTNVVSDNTITFTGALATVTEVAGIRVSGAATQSVTVSDNVVSGNDVDPGAPGDSAGILIAADVPLASVIVISRNTVTGLIDGVHVAGRAVLRGNVLIRNDVGVNVVGGTALLERNVLNSNTAAGLRIQSGGIVDAGQVTTSLNFTGLGVSIGGNIFLSYQPGVGQPAAIENLNVDGTPGPLGGTADVRAEGNVFRSVSGASIEQVVLHDVDNPNLGFVDFLPARSRGRVAIAAGVGDLPIVCVLDAETGEDLFEIEAFNLNFTGGVRVATADVTGDFVADIIVAAGPGGGPHVRVFDGITGEQVEGSIGSFFAYNVAFTGGVFVAAGDIDGDHLADIVTGADAGGGPHVRVFSGETQQVLNEFFAYNPIFGGGVRVAVGDVDGNDLLDIITGAGPGGGPHVRVFTGLGGTQIAGSIGSFFAYDAKFAGGVFVAAGDFNGDGQDDVVTGAGAGGGPHVRVFSGPNVTQLREFFAYAPSFTGGVRVAVVDFLGDLALDVLVGPGPDAANATQGVRVFHGDLTFDEIDCLEADDLQPGRPEFAGGRFVAGDLVDLDVLDAIFSEL